VGLIPSKGDEGCRVPPCTGCVKNLFFGFSKFVFPWGALRTRKGEPKPLDVSSAPKDSMAAWEAQGLPGRGKTAGGTHRAADCKVVGNIMGDYYGIIRVSLHVALMFPIMFRIAALGIHPEFFHNVSHNAGGAPPCAFSPLGPDWVRQNSKNCTRHPGRQSKMIKQYRKNMM